MTSFNDKLSAFEPPITPGTPAPPPQTGSSADNPSVPASPDSEVAAPHTTASVPLRSAAEIDLQKFNQLVGDWAGKPVDDLKRLFTKQVILDDQTTVNSETIKVPGFIGITDDLQVQNANGQTVSGHEDIAKFLDRDGLYICTYQWHKERYGVPLDLRQPLAQDIFTEAFIKNEGHHSGAVVPAQRKDSSGNLTKSYATYNEPDSYHGGLYGSDGYVAVAQRLVFPEFVTPKQARGYTDSIVCWMGLLNPFTQFPSNYNGGDPTRVSNRAALTEILKNSLLAALGDPGAIAFFKNPANLTYCAEFIFVNLNTPVYPFNKRGLAKLLNGDEAKAAKILELRDQHNRGQSTVLSRQTGNPEFKKFHIQMPVVPEDLLPLDELLAANGQNVKPDTIPVPPFKVSQLIRRAFRVLLKPEEVNNDRKLSEARAKLFKSMEPAIIQQLGLENLPPSAPELVAVRQFLDIVVQTLSQPASNREEFDQQINGLLAKADEMLVGAGDRAYFVPPRIYVDLGQRDGDQTMPKGWGFRLETVGALVARGVIKG
ncbi:hypothetical protein H6F93_09905 [Leptolyngbya sp. FACHB-671]|uniref:hypothetical protein n=1 Tax=Leptolyngbya sp. FACHB-671 TaxID=2692812 RepID=UPI00168940D9|nr:hypothetical protein [Leptolyngbya sp. FACHB-671]MBD2067831.1 hypothetical protein [Leptolyngbya sp. FACHB-671]